MANGYQINCLVWDMLRDWGFRDGVYDGGIDKSLVWRAGEAGI